MMSSNMCFIGLVLMFGFTSAIESRGDDIRSVKSRSNIKMKKTGSSVDGADTPNRINQDGSGTTASSLDSSTSTSGTTAPSGGPATSSDSTASEPKPDTTSTTATTPTTTVEKEKHFGTFVSGEAKKLKEQPEGYKNFGQMVSSKRRQDALHRSQQSLDQNMPSESSGAGAKSNSQSNPGKGSSSNAGGKSHGNGH